MAASRLRRAGIAAAALLALAVSFIGGKEGLELVAYRDIVGVPTVCFGETRGVHMGDRYTIEECRTMLGDGLEEFATGMEACLRAPDTLPGKSYVAFLSAAYNIGRKAFCGSSMARRWNAGNLAGACDALLLWNKAAGKVIAGLTRRRQEERALCLEGLAEGAPS
jgi:lysozyme